MLLQINHVFIKIYSSRYSSVVLDRESTVGHLLLMQRLGLPLFVVRYAFIILQW